MNTNTMNTNTASAAPSTPVDTVDPIDVIHRAQQALAKFLPPNSGIHPNACIGELLGILDSRGAAALTAHIQRQDDERSIRRQMTRLFLEFMQGAAKVSTQEVSVNSSSEDAHAVIARLRDELQRRRDHETHLIRSRDELIQKLCAAEKRLKEVRFALA